MASAAPGGVPAFPGAEGYGAGAIGGRGGAVLFVTNLNDSGPGSLRAAVEASGPRTVVFRVAGVITLDRELRIDDPYLTIAGQTAPLPGITLRMNPSAEIPGVSESLIGVETHDVVIRYLKLRRGESRLSGDNLDIRDPSYNVIVDHVSFSWSTDESIEVWTYEETDAEQASGVQRVSIQHSIITESIQQDTARWLDPQIEHTPAQLADPEYTDYAGDLNANNHPLAVAVGGRPDHEAWRQVRDIDFHHNLFAHNTHRNPRVRSAGIRLINNVVYNWFTRAGSSKYSTHVDYIGNLYQHGPMTLTVDGGSQPPRPRFLWHDVTNAAGDITDAQPGSLYLVSNIAPAIPEMAVPEYDNWNMLMESWSGDPRGESPQLDVSLRRNYPLPEAPFPVHASLPDAADRTSLVADAGASRFLAADGSFVSHRDFVDERTVRSLETGRTRFIRKSRLYRTSAQTGGYEALDVQLSDPYPDDDADGMSDVWEAAFGVDFRPDADSDSDGYTDLEEFLNGTDPVVAEQTGVPDAVLVAADTYGTLLIDGVSGGPRNLTVRHDDEAGVLVVTSVSADLTADRVTGTDRVEIPLERVTHRLLITLGSAGDRLDLTGVRIPAVISAGAGHDTVWGTDAGDLLLGGDGDDVLFGGSGHDRLIGMGGADELWGQAGDDVLLGGAGSDRLDGGTGDDLLRGQGSSGDWLTGGPGGNTLDGGAGADRLFEISVAESISLTPTELRQGGDLSILSGLELASISGSGVSVTIDARSFHGPVTLRGTSGSDTLLGGAGSDLLLGFGGHDILVGADGSDTLNGHAGADSLFGGSGSDLLRGHGSSGDRLIGGAGADTLDGGRGRDRLAADDEDTVVADARDLAIAASLPDLFGL